MDTLQKSSFNPNSFTVKIYVNVKNRLLIVTCPDWPDSFAFNHLHLQGSWLSKLQFILISFFFPNSCSSNNLMMCSLRLKVHIKSD